MFRGVKMRKASTADRVHMCFVLVYAAGSTAYGVWSGNHDWILGAVVGLAVYFAAFFYFAFYGVRQREQIEVRFVGGDEKR